MKKETGKPFDDPKIENQPDTDPCVILGSGITIPISNDDFTRILRNATTGMMDNAVTLESGSLVVLRHIAALMPGK